VAKVELKQPIVAAIAEDIKDAQSVVIVDYRGLTVAPLRQKTQRFTNVLFKKNSYLPRQAFSTLCLTAPAVFGSQLLL